MIHPSPQLPPRIQCRHRLARLVPRTLLKGTTSIPRRPLVKLRMLAGLKEGTGGDEGEAAQEISSEEDSESAAETVESDTADPANDEAAPVVAAPDVDAVMAATHVAQVAGEAVHLPMITIKLDDRALAPAASAGASP